MTGRRCADRPREISEGGLSENCQKLAPMLDPDGLTVRMTVQICVLVSAHVGITVEQRPLVDGDLSRRESELIQAVVDEPPKLGETAVREGHR